MKRIICHWTAGTHKAGSIDREHYHYIIEADGKVVTGVHSIADNMNISDGRYAAHTLHCNDESIGLSLACMYNAKPGKHGKYPMTRTQFDAMAKLAAALCLRYSIAVTPKTVLWHAEVQGTLGIKQRNKWDATELSFAPTIKGAKACGIYLRDAVMREMDRMTSASVNPKPTPKPKPSIWRKLVPTKPSQPMAMRAVEIPAKEPAMLSGYKTYITGIFMILAGALELYGIDVVPGVDSSNAATMIANGFAFIFLRQGVTAENKKASE